MSVDTKVYKVAQTLSNQQWDTIGSIGGYTNTTKSKKELEYEVSCLFTLRLDILNASRLYPKYSISRIINELSSGMISCSSEVVYKELCNYISKIQSLYNDVPYHSFYHAAQVTTSMNKLITMLIDEEDSSASTASSRRSSYNDVNLISKDKYTVTNGIGNDALTQFALLFSALIHDVGHLGISNMQLAKERHELALTYNDQSVAEQNSISTSFLLLYNHYTNLLNAIAPTAKERQRFRRLVIEIVMCTDIASPDRTQLAKSKWKEAYEARNAAPMPRTDHKFRSASTIVRTLNTNRTRFGIRRALDLSGDKIDFYTENDIKRSTVLEQMMALADISHLFQDFETLKIWNEKLFHELMVAHSQNRGFDPCGFWFNGQIGFIDNYVIPLADRLSICDVFGENSFLFLKNAKEIRRRWCIEGLQFCEELSDKYSDYLES